MFVKHNTEAIDYSQVLQDTKLLRIEVFIYSDPSPKVRDNTVTF